MTPASLWRSFREVLGSRRIGGLDLLQRICAND